MQNKIVFITLPWWDVEDIPLAPAILKGILDSHNIQSSTIDFNLDLYNLTNKNLKLYEQLKMYFLFNDRTHYQIIEEYYDLIIKKLDEVNCDTVGISVFSVWTQRAVLDLCIKIKKQNKPYKLLVGGRGLSVKPYTSIKNELTAAEQLITFGDILKKRKLADHYILGDGEDAVVEYATTNSTDNDVIYYANEKLEYPFSNFDDYRLDLYHNEFSKKQLPVISSKGCVRSCDFCDVSKQLGRFKSKTGERLAEEMIFLANKYKIYNFRTADSIVNGNIKELRITCQLLKKYNDMHTNKIKWSGNWIARPPNACKPEFFDLLAESGCESLTIGAESGSNNVLQAMNKKTTVEGLFYELDQIKRVGIQCYVNNVIAHWSETRNDFYDHLKMLVKLGPYIATNTITNILLGAGFSLLDDTPAVTGPGKLISTSGNFNYLWFSPVNPALTLKARYSRVYMLYKVANLLNYSLIGEFQFLHALEELKNKTEIENFYKQFNSIINTVPQCSTITDALDVEKILDNIIRTEFKTSTIKLTVTAEAVNGDPNLIIAYNNKELVHRLLTEGTHFFEFQVPLKYDTPNNLTISMNNKGPMDTILGDQGNILKDKKIVFTQFTIDDVPVIQEPYFRSCTKFYKKNGESAQSEPGLWGNNKLVIEFTGPFWQHFLACKRNLVYNKFPAEKLNRLLAEFLQEIQNLEF